MKLKLKPPVSINKVFISHGHQGEQNTYSTNPSLSFLFETFIDLRILIIVMCKT